MEEQLQTKERKKDEGIELRGFEPGKAAKQTYLYTRKKPFSVGKDGRIVLPGLFQTHDLRRDTLGFLGAVLLEAYGLFNLYLVAQFEWAFVVGLFFS